MRIPFEFYALVFLAFLLAGCAGPTFAPEVAPEAIVVHDRTPLYHYGPQQGMAPEAQLSRNERVRVLRHELGYSLVQIFDGQTGYVANEDLAPAPPLNSSMESSEPDEHDNPPPLSSIELPKPDLNTIPKDAPME